MQSKRTNAILRILDEVGTVSIADLAGQLGVSAETVRRDLRPLCDSGTLLRMHGAVGLVAASGEAPFQRRMRENAAAKQAIARALAATIRNGATLMMDTGTTTSFLARALVGHRGLTVITNSTDAARTLSPAGHRVLLPGGAFRPDSGAVLGPEAIDFVLGFSAEVAVISAGACMSGEVTDFDRDEAAFARALLTRAERRVCATDAAKFGRRGLVTVTPYSGLTELATEAPPPADEAAALKAAGTRLTICG